MRILGVMLGVLVLFSCNQQNGIQISGKYDSPVDGLWAKIELIKNEKITVVDSFQIDESGLFDQSVVVEEPAFYRLNFYGRHMANMILSDTDVEVYNDGNDQQGIYKIRGSRDMDFIYELTALRKEFESKTNQLNQEFAELRMELDEQEQKETLEKFRARYLDMKSSHEREMKNAIYAMDNSIAGMLATSFLDEQNEFAFLDSLANKYQKQLPNSAYTAELVNKVDVMRKLAVGSPAPDLVLPTPNGESLALSSLRGKYVLIDFWAAWCGPCRKENPNVVRMYQKYGGNKFEILGVSLDRKKDAWIKAISDDGLTWPQISDLKYFESEAAKIYNINSIPATYLIGPDGTIVAKNLRGPSLEAKLEEIFG